jgi:hypothetical protein
MQPNGWSSQEDLAKFGYRPDIKTKKLNSELFYILASYYLLETSSKNLMI